MDKLLGSFALLLLGVLCGLVPACSGGPASAIGAAMFAPCPPSPNCVSSDARDSRHAIVPFVLKSPPGEVWPQLRAAVLALPRTRILADDENYLRAECRSAVFRFRDDLEIQLRAETGLLAVRSASRSGYYDFGVNRRRLETLRALLQKRGLVE